MSELFVNRRMTLAGRPEGLPDSSCWKLVESDLRSPEKGEVQVRVIYISIDPAMRGWISDRKSYIEPVEIGATMRALGIGQVVQSNSGQYQVGDYVSGFFGVQEYATVLADESMYALPATEASLASHLGVLGMPGMTAYFGLLDVGKPQQGETVLVSGAAGAVGAVVGQIAKIRGCRVVGVAGGKKKCDYLVDQLGFNAAIDYKSEQDLTAAIASACTEGIDVFFDNVGGDILNVALLQLNNAARVVICGAISAYNDEGASAATINYLPILYARARLEGFVILNYLPRYPEGIAKMCEWLAAGKISAKEDIYAGVDQFPDVLLKLFNGENFGKLILQVGEESSKLCESNPPHSNQPGESYVHTRLSH